MNSIVSSILNAALSSYVEKFNSSDVDLSVWSGEAVLKNLKIRADALDSFDLPVTVRIGYIGQITLKFDWKRISTKPVEVFVDDVFLVASAKTKFGVDEEEEIKKNFTAKIEALKAWTAVKLEPVQEGGKKDPSGYSLVEKIIDNIHVRVNHVHIRYEHGLPDGSGKISSLGVVIESLVAQTTDEAWKPTFLEEKEIFVRKFVQMKKFGLYFCSREDPYTLDMLHNFWKKDIFQFQPYVLRPLTLTVKLTQNKNMKYRKWRYPEFQVDTHIDMISLYLAQDQYSGVLDLAAGLTYGVQYGAYQRYKPKMKVLSGEPGSKRRKKAVRAYWKWALKCVSMDLQSDGKQRVSWKKMIQQRKDKERYIALFSRTLNTPWLEPPDEYCTNEIERIERRYDYDLLVYFRQCSISEVDFMLGPETQVVSRANMQQSSGLLSGISSWWGGKKKSSDKNPKKVLSKKQKVQLHDKVRALVSQDENEIPESYVRYKVLFKLTKSSLGLYPTHAFGANGYKMTKESIKQTSDPILGIGMKGVVANLQVRTNNIIAAVQLAEVYGDDKKTKNSKYQRFLYSSNPDPKSKVPFANLYVNMNPLDTWVQKNHPNQMVEKKEANDNPIIYVDLKTLPVHVYVWLPYLMTLGDFFAPPQSARDMLYAMEAAAWSEISDLKTSTSVAMESALEQHPELHLDISIAAPTIILPEDMTDIHSSKLIVELGTLKINSDFSSSQEQKEKDENAIKKIESQQTVDNANYRLQIKKEYYDSFQISIENMRIYTDLDSADNYLLQPFSLHLFLHMSILPSAMIPSIGVEGKLDSINIVISSSQLRKVIRIVDAMLPEELPESSVTVEDVTEEKVAGAPALVQAGTQEAEELKKLQEATVKQKHAFVDKINTVVGFAIEKVAFSLINDDYRLKKAEGVYTNNNHRAEYVRRLKTLGLTGDTFAVPVLSVAIQGMGLTMIQRTFDMKVQFGLQDMIVKDMYQTYSDQYKYWVCTHNPLEPKQEEQKQGNFIDVGVFIDSCDSPSFFDVDMKIDAKFGSLFVSVTPTSLLHLLNFVDGSVLPALTPKKTKAIEAEAKRVQENPEAKKEEVVELIPVQTSSQKLGRLVKSMEINASFEALKLFFNTETPSNGNGHELTTFAIAAIQDLRTSIDMWDKDMELNAQIGAMVLEDLTPEGRLSDKTKHMIRVLENETARRPLLLEVNLKMFDKEQEYREYPGYGMDVDCNVEGMEIFFTMRFVDELLRYVSSGPILELTDRAPEIDTSEYEEYAARKQQELLQSIQENAADEAITMYETFPRIKFKVQRMNLIIPRSTLYHSESMELTFDLSLQTKFEIEAKNQVKIEFGPFGFEARHVVDNIPRRWLPLLKAQSMSVQLNNSFDKIDIQMGKIESVFCQDHYFLLMRVLGENLSETSSLLAVMYDLPIGENEKVVTNAPAHVENKQEEKEEKSASKDLSLELLFGISGLSVDLRKKDGNPSTEQLISLKASGFLVKLKMYTTGELDVRVGMKARTDNGLFPLDSLCDKTAYPGLREFLNEMKFVKEDYLKVRSDNGSFPLNYLCYGTTFPEFKEFLDEMKFVKEDYLKARTDTGSFPLNTLCYEKPYLELKEFLDEMKFVKEDYLQARTDSGSFPLHGLCLRNSYPELREFLDKMKYSAASYMKVPKKKLNSPIKCLFSNIRTGKEFAELCSSTIFNNVVSSQIQTSQLLISFSDTDLVLKILSNLGISYSPLPNAQSSLFDCLPEHHKTIVLYNSLNNQESAELLVPQFQKIPGHVLRNTICNGDFLLNKLSQYLPYSYLSQFIHQSWNILQETSSGDTPLINICKRNNYSKIENCIIPCSDSDLLHENNSKRSALSNLFEKNKYEEMKSLFDKISSNIVPNSAKLLKILCSHNTSSLFIEYLCSDEFKQVHFCGSNYENLRSLCNNVEYSILSPFLSQKLDFKEIGKDLLDVPIIVYHLARHQISLANELFELENFDRSILFKQIEGTRSPFYWICRHQSNLLETLLPLNVPDLLPRSLASDSWLFWIARIDWISIIDNGWVENLEKKDILGDALDHMRKSGHFEFSRLVVKFGITVEELEKSNPEALYWCCRNNFDCLSSFDLTSRALFQTFDEKGTPFSQLCMNRNPILNKIFDESEELKISDSDLLDKQGDIVPLNELMKYKGFKHMSRVLKICNLSRDKLLESDRIINICKNHPHCLVELKDLLNPEDFMILKDSMGRSALSWLSEAPYLPEYSKMLPSSVESDIIGFIDTDSPLLDLFLESSVTKMYLRKLNGITTSQKFIVCLNHGCFEEAVYYWNKLKPQETVRPSPFLSPLTIASRDERMAKLVEAAKMKLKKDQLDAYERKKEIEDTKLTDIPAHSMKRCTFGQSGEMKFVVADLAIRVDFLNDLKVMKASKLLRSVQPISKRRARLIFEEFDFTLRELLCSKGVLDREEAKFVLKCILKELAALHSRAVHVLKIIPDNIVFTKIGQEWNVSFIISSNYEEYLPKNEGPDDIWSLGIVYVEMLTGNPCEGKEEVKDSVIEAMLGNAKSRKKAIEILSILENESDVELVLGNKNLKTPDLHEVSLEIGKSNKFSRGARIQGTEWFSGRIHCGERWEKVHIKKASSLFELDVGLSLIHPNIRPLLGSWKDGDLTYLAYEPMENLGDIHDTNRFVPQIHDIIRDLGSTAQYLHKKGIVHGMISPKSIYLKQGAVFFGDFADSFVYVQHMMVRNKRSDCYRPLEPLLELGSDLWSLGRVIAELLGIDLPNPVIGGSEDEIWDHWLHVCKKIKKADLKDESRSHKFQRILLGLLQEHPKHRTISEEIVSL